MRFFALAALCMAFSLGGCSLMGSKPDKESGEVAAVMSTQRPVAPTDLIATDFVNALRQLKSMPASATTVALQRTEQDDPFTRAMYSALQSAGYGIRWVQYQGSNMLFQYRQVTETAAGSVQRTTYELAVGDVEMRRSYALDKTSRVHPVSPLYVRGTDASGIVLSDEIFDTATPALAMNSSIASDELVDDPRVVDVNAVPLKPLATINNTTSSTTLALQNASTLKVPSDANPLNPIVGKAVSGRPLSLPLVELPRVENVFDLGGSNFEDVLSSHTILTEQVLTFANDSMRLGEQNKRLVEQLVERFNPETDIFSVIGCSMGPTQVKGGNAALALGRAGRVVEALRFAGVDDSHILDEGCWAGDGALENLPRRGVVLTLNRRG